MSRTLETIGVLIWLSSWQLFFVGPMVLMHVLFYTNYWYLAAAYLAWIVYDRNTAKEGGRGIEFMRRLPIWTWVCQYFSMQIIKTAELDPSKNYLLGYHPHGNITTGYHGNFAAEGNNVSKVFPGMKTHFLTVDLMFRVPLIREIALALGGCSVSRESMNYLLSNEKGGNAVFMVPGGAREVLLFQPGTEVVYLKKRKGFIKVAIENGSPLVPIYSFGESDVYTQHGNPPGSWLRYFQEKLIDFGGVPLTFVTGNGLLPRRYPVISVVGAPILVEKTTSPSQEYIDKIHTAYMEALSDLYYKHRSKYGHPDVDLVIQ